MTYFREVQPLRRQRLIVVIVIVATVVVLVSLSASGGSTLWGAVVAVGTLGLAAALVLAANLVTTVDREAITVAFHFLWPKRRIPTSGVRQAVATTYRPLLDSGGYGVRLGFRGWAFNVSGNEGGAGGDERRLAPHDRLAASERARGRRRAGEGRPTRRLAGGHSGPTPRRHSRAASTPRERFRCGLLFGS